MKDYLACKLRLTSSQDVQIQNNIFSVDQQEQFKFIARYSRSVSFILKDATDEEPVISVIRELEKFLML